MSIDIGECKNVVLQRTRAKAIPICAGDRFQGSAPIAVISRTVRTRSTRPAYARDRSIFITTAKEIAAPQFNGYCLSFLYISLHSLERFSQSLGTNYTLACSRSSAAPVSSSSILRAREAPR